MMISKKAVLFALLAIGCSAPQPQRRTLGKLGAAPRPGPAQVSSAGAAIGYSVVDVGWAVMSAKLGTPELTYPDVYDAISSYSSWAPGGGGGPKSMGTSYVFFTVSTWTGCRLTWIAAAGRTVKCTAWIRRGPTYTGASCNVTTTVRGIYSCTFSAPLTVPATQEIVLMYGDVSGTDYSALYQFGNQQPPLPSLWQKPSKPLGMIVATGFTCTDVADPAACSGITTGPRLGLVEPTF